MASSASGKAADGKEDSNAPVNSSMVEGAVYREIIKPSIGELSKEVRTNILCTVQGCGKILPNTPALNMHLVKSHRVKVNVQG